MGTNKTPKYKLNSKTGEFIIENYNFAKPFANFFPGIAGPYGIPIWVFYVNRGQAISSFGTRDKDHAILEFLPANKAWQMTSLQGFRTFIKVIYDKNKPLTPTLSPLGRGKRVRGNSFYEPFHNCLTNAHFNLHNQMSIASDSLKLQEDNLSIGMRVNVEYWTVPNDNFGGLIRIVTITNTGKSTKNIQLIDGLPQIVPFGTTNWFLKKMSRTIEAWMRVENLENNAPFYKLAVDPSDKPEVIPINEGNFYLAFHCQNGKNRLLKPIIDPQSVFGPITDFTAPYLFLTTPKFRPPKEEPRQGKTPSAFFFSDFQLRPCEEKTFYVVAGYILNQKTLNDTIPRIISNGYIPKKRQENISLIGTLQEDIYTKSAINKFDLYAKQTYLDNILRGGYPLTISYGPHKTIVYLYSRKHGDLERDYNNFHIQPTYFSQGNANYRDINQNRRSDIWFNPDIKDENVIAFFNLLQTDGFNPLVVKGVTFSLNNPYEILRRPDERSDVGAPQDDPDLCRGHLNNLAEFLNKPFTIGELILFIEKNRIKLNLPRDVFLAQLLSDCSKHHQAEHSEGFWTDHWTYNLDLLESYLGVYPENLKQILLDKKVFTFFDNSEIVKSRQEKYILYHGKPRQLHSIHSDTAKKELLHKRDTLPHITRAQYGQGEIYQTSLLNKILCLCANKMASLDPCGIGIEMEADKPNWYDALNGLPALFGSSICETFELKRLIAFTKDVLKKTNPDKVAVTEEIHHFLIQLNDLTKDYLESAAKDKDFSYWDKTHSAMEDYRHKTKLGVSGKELELDSGELILFLDNFLKKLDGGIEKAFDKQKNIYCAYFINEITDYKVLDNPAAIKPLKFTQRRLPLFLAAQMHALKLTPEVNKARILYQRVKNSILYDKKLKMYKVTASLKEMPQEIGRCCIFPKGWLENESIWLHMEYKYLLEILRLGLYEEFYCEFKNLLIPFQKPARYGRSILENSSFIVSSAFTDKKLHGNGFVARLSGSTAEFLHIWLIMNTGTNPFYLNENHQLNLRFRPILTNWLFDKKGNYSFTFLSKIAITYHNPKRKNTFGKNPAQINKINFNDKTAAPVEILSDTIPFPYASQIRDRQIKQIEVYLG